MLRRLRELNRQPNASYDTFKKGIEHPDPTMEDAFIHLVESADREMEAAA